MKKQGGDAKKEKPRLILFLLFLPKHLRILPTEKN
jgi:hypothetical protein